MEWTVNGDFYVAEWLVQPQLGTVTKAGQAFGLEPKVMQVLVCLAGHAGEVLPKQIIIQNVWSNAFVTDEVLTNAISTLRKTFKDDAKNPKYIQTLPKRGYRLIAPVNYPADHSGSEDGGLSDGRGLSAGWRILVWLGAGGVVAVLVALGLVNHFGGGGSEAPIDSIAVLPFECTLEDAETASLATGIPEFISSSLLSLDGLRVKSPTVLKRYVGEDIDPRTVSEEQSVRAVLTGRVHRRGKTLTVRVELIDGEENNLLWSQGYRRPSSDVFEIEEDIARNVARALRGLTDVENLRLAERGTKSLEAYDAFRVGRYQLRRWPSPDPRTSFGPAIPFFEKALEIDPYYQDAYYVLGNTYFGLARNYYAQSDDDFRRAREYWEKLIAVDGSTALAHWTKARISWQFERNWKEADREYEKAVEMPDTLPTYRSWFLEWMGRRSEYSSSLEVDVKKADPLSPLAQGWIAWRSLWNREYQRAIEHSRRTLALEPQWVDPWVIISFSHELKGDEREAFEAALRALKNQGADVEKMRAATETFNESGLKGVRRLSQYHHGAGFNPRPIKMVMSFVRLGDKEQAFEWLKKSWDDPLWGSENAPSNPFLDPLRGDPRFEQLLREQKLPDDVIQEHLALPR